MSNIEIGLKPSAATTVFARGNFVCAEGVSKHSRRLLIRLSSALGVALMLFACNASVRATTITCFENPSDDRGEVLSCASAGFSTAPAFSQSKPSSPGSSYTEIHSGRDVPRGGGAFRGKMTGSEYIVEISLLEGGGGLSAGRLRANGNLVLLQHDNPKSWTVPSRSAITLY